MPGPLVRWDPFAELSEMRAQLERMFSPFDRKERSWMPAIDVVHDNGNLIIRADVPGTSAEEVKIEVEDGILTISGQHEEHTDEQHKHYVRRERRCGSFSRSIALPDGVDPEDITAKTQDGVVEVTIPLPNQASKEKVQITPTAG